MTKKIEGWISSGAFTDPCNAGCSFSQHMRPLLADQKATLVIGDERVFTESEVKAMLRSITHCTGSPLASIHIEEVRRVFADEHGIVLDPA